MNYYFILYLLNIEFNLYDIIIYQVLFNLITKLKLYY